MDKKKIIRFLDGIHLKNSILASAQRVEQNREQLDAINVFPVADGDTGANMAETMRTIVEGAQEVEHESFAEMSSAIADSALEGARGNSGVILAQFFQGLADKVVGKKRVRPHEFAKAVNGAVIFAESAVSQPKEGTILTVMRDWAAYIQEHAHLRDFTDLLKGALARARQSLADTPNKLPVLRKANVVDAGAQGFVHILEGIQEFLENGRLAALTAGSHVLDKIRHHQHREAEVRFQFCTQCLIAGEVDREALKRELAPFGDSLIVIGGHGKVRLHIHSNHPQQVFEIAARFGRVQKTKIEDMLAQSRQRGELIRNGIALVTDSTCDLPEAVFKQHQIRIVPVFLKIQDRTFIDRVEIQPEEFYRLFAESGGVISTSQPSTGSFNKVYQEVAGTHRSIISIHISGQISGTLNGAQVAARSLKASLPFEIIDSRSTTVGLGLIVQEAARLIERGLPHDQVVEKVKSAVERLRFFVSIPSLKQLLKSGRVPKMKGWLGELLHIKPVISFDPDGKVAEVAKVIGLKAVRAKVYELAARYAETVKNPRFGIAHVMNRPLAESYRERLVRQFATDDVFIIAASPALGAHVGFGACGIAVLGD